MIFFNCYGCWLFIWAEFHWYLSPYIFGHINLFLGRVVKVKRIGCETYPEFLTIFLHVLPTPSILIFPISMKVHAYYLNSKIAKYSSQDSVKIIETKMISLAHFVLTALHMVQMTLAYFLMLIVMTYNTWLCLSVIFGSTLGYFLFGWRKTTVVDVSDHCHWHQLLWNVHVPKLHPILSQKHRLFSKFFKAEKPVYSKIKVV